MMSFISDTILQVLLKGSVLYINIMLNMSIGSCIFKTHDALETAVPAYDTLCTLTITGTMDTVEHNIYIIYQLLNIHRKITFDEENPIPRRDCADVI
jgi:hypothetical protein